MKKSIKLSALLLCVSTVVTLAACREIRWTAKDDTLEYYYTESEIVTDEVVSTYSFPYETNDESDFGSMSLLPGSFTLKEPNNGVLMCDSRTPTFSWNDSSEATEYTIIIELYDEETKTFNEQFRETGITESTHTLSRKLADGEIYRWCVVAQNKYGKKYSEGANEDYYEVFMSYIDSSVHPANVGKNFDFDYSISQEVLCNYLSRAATGSVETAYLNLDRVFSISLLRNILYTGTKYVSRSGCVWSPNIQEIESLSGQKKFIAKAHEYDSDIIFEACLFEHVSEEVETIPIPAWVFEAFGLKTENRNFDYEKIVYTGTTCPDMGAIEAQMLFYYRACMYIDAGFEAFHMGQMDLIARNEINTWECTTKVFNMIREYAQKNARRHFVLINAHATWGNGTSGKTYVSAVDGKLIYDFVAFPLRATTTETEAHPPSENAPQTQYLKVGQLDSVYGRAEGGLTHSGWTCENIPYFIEFDNATVASTYQKDFPTPGAMVNWGRDDISWFASQPASYRAYWLDYATNWLAELKTEHNEDAFLCVPLTRIATPYGYTSGSRYDASSNLFATGGYSDIFAIRDIWIKNNN